MAITAFIKTCAQRCKSSHSYYL